MSDAFPRLLVATEFPPNASGGGPAVVRQMLKDWPVEKLFWWSCLPDLEQLFGQRVASHSMAWIPPKLYPNRRIPRLKSWFLERFWVPRATNHLRKTITDIQPDIIWVIPHLWAILPLADVLLASSLNFHVTVQDYMDTNTAIQRFGRQRCRRLIQATEQLYANAATRDATSHPMIADLLAKTRCSAQQMLHAGIESQKLHCLRDEIQPDTERIRIAYAGTIVVEMEFAHFVSALKQIRQKLSRPVSLEFFGNHSYRARSWFDSSWMFEHGNMADETLNAALRECSWGFSPMALTDDDPRYNRFSFPTKFISYLAAGLPIISLGHPESSVVKMASQYNVGLCTSTADTEILSAQLLAALSVADPKSKYGLEIRRCALGEFDAAKMRSVLYDCFRKRAVRSKD